MVGTPDEHNSGSDEDWYDAQEDSFTMDVDEISPMITGADSDQRTGASARWQSLTGYVETQL